MDNKNTILKFIFGLVVFAFSLTLAYSIAVYTRNNDLFDFWGALIVMSAIYISIGLLVVTILPISFGFLFSADVLILNLLVNNFGDWQDITKVFVVGIVLLILYVFAWLKFSNDDIILDQINLSDDSKQEPESETEALVKDDEIFSDVESLNDKINSVNISNKEKVIFSPNGQKEFSTIEPIIIKIAVFTEQSFGKSSFSSNELKPYYHDFVSKYKPTLSEDKVKIVLGKFYSFVESGGSFKII